jgi:hypothetical protein
MGRGSHFDWPYRIPGNRRVQTAQIAPTILKLLGLDPKALRAVQLEHAGALPIGDQGE